MYISRLPTDWALGSFYQGMAFYTHVIYIQANHLVFGKQAPSIEQLLGHFHCQQVPNQTAGGR